MKHLQIFEEFNQDYFRSIEPNEYQINVSGDEYPGIEFDIKYAEENWYPFTDYEIEKIKTLLNSEDYKYTIASISLTGNYNGNPSNNKGEIIIDGFSNHPEMENITITIIKLKDEWYYIFHEDNDEYYACDQFVGLEQCLKTIIR